MQPVLRIASALLVLAGVTFLAGAPLPTLIDHSFHGLVTRRGEPVVFAKELAEKKPELVLLGNSILDRAVDGEEFERLIGRPSLKVSHAGAATALWYIMLKNLIARAEHPPETVAIFFRTIYLTEPAFRVGRQFKPQLDYYIEGEEPELDRIAYFEHMHRVPFTLNRFWSLYQRRDALRLRTEEVFKADLVESLSGQAAEDIRSTVSAVFAEERRQDQRVDEARFEAWLELREPFDFDGRVTRSFLPLIIDVARSNDISLIFVRMRTRLDARTDVAAKRGVEARGGIIRSLLPRYIESLRAYLEANGVQLLDLSGDERIRPSDFDREDHLNEGGRALFTPYLAEKLEPLLP